MKVQASKERLLVLRLHPPALLRVRGYAINRLRILLYGPGGSGKSTLAHAWLHYAERSEGTVRVDGKDVPFRFVPVGLLLESGFNPTLVRLRLFSLQSIITNWQ